MCKAEVIFIWTCSLVLLLKTGTLESANCTGTGNICKNGECISSDLFCDGEKDCADGSDETAELCLTLKCPEYAFQCAYGACVKGNSKCDGFKDCADNSDENSVLCGEDRLYKNGKCLKHYFQCNSGHCIPVEDVCDGTRDCVDGSDETVDICAGRYCPVFAFRCGYGACVSGAAICDGVPDCYDGSDEFAILCGDKFTATTKRPSEITPISTSTIIRTTTKPTTTTTRTTTTTTTSVTVQKPTSGCVIRTRPDLIVVLHATNEIIPMGEYIGDFQRISYRCRSKYLLEGYKSNYCLGGNWITPHPTCIRFCQNNIIHGETFTANCKYNGVTISCNDPIKPGTVVHITCKDGYRKPNRVVQEYLRCDEFGEWTYTPFRCEPICGTTATDLGFSEKTVTYVPWHVPIYSKLTGRYEQICGGTIINAKLIVSAANCFWNVVEKRPYNNSYFSVATGKQFRDYSAEEALPVQFFNVMEIFIPNGYQDLSLSSQNDIALLVLDKFIEFKSYVKPICVEWLSHSESTVASGRIAHVASWCKTATNQPSSKKLHLTELETVSRADCLVRISARFRSVVADDKFCLTSSNDDTLCSGDSGAGLVIPKTINGVEKYFLWGVLSSVGECDLDEFQTLTNIQFHSLRIQDYELRFRPR